MQVFSSGSLFQKFKLECTGYSYSYYRSNLGVTRIVQRLLTHRWIFGESRDLYTVERRKLTLKFNTKERFVLSIPILLLIGLIWKYSVDMPQMDEWEYVSIIEKYYSGNLTFQDLWSQHNEHRIFFPRIITLCNIVMLGWNLYVNMATTVLFAIGCAYVIIKMLSESGIAKNKVFWLAFSANWIIFSFNQANNWLWGFQLAFALAVFASLLSIYIIVMKKCNVKNTIMSAVAAMISIYSSANGLFILPAGFLILCVVSHQYKQHIALWTFLVGGAAGCYFINFHFIDAHGGFSHNLISLFQNPEQFVIGLGIIISRIITKTQYVSLALATMAVSWQIYLIIEYRRLYLEMNKSYIGLFGIGVYSLLCVLFIDFGRFTIGGLDAQRYIIFSLYFWVSLLCQTAIILDKKKKNENEFIVVVSIISVVISLYGSLDAESYAEKTKMVLSEFKRQIVSSQPVDADFFTAWIYPDRNKIAGMAVLKRNNIRNFQCANSEFDAEFLEIGKDEYIEKNNCAWNIDDISINPEKVVVIKGWAYIKGVNNQLNTYKLIMHSANRSYVSTLKNENRDDLIDAVPDEINLYHCGFLGWNKVYAFNVEPGDYNLYIGIENVTGKYMCPLNKKIHVD